MIERFTSRERRESGAESVENLENIREHLDLRLRFAQAVSAKSKLPLPEVLLGYTDVARRMFGRMPQGDVEREVYEKQFLDAMGTELTAKEHPDQLDSLERLFLSRYRSFPTKERRYAPFDYDYNPAAATVHPHFGSMSYEKLSNSPRYLSEEEREPMKMLLRDMFLDIKSSHPDAKRVEGQSWLYNDARYRALFPDTYTATHEERRGGFLGGGRWGQFRRGDGSVHHDRAQQFLNNIQHLDMEHLEAAFPLQTWIVSAPIEDFYAEYGIE